MRERQARTFGLTLDRLSILVVAGDRQPVAPNGQRNPEQGLPVLLPLQVGPIRARFPSFRVDLRIDAIAKQAVCQPESSVALK